jgi:hypothetical protein
VIVTRTPLEFDERAFKKLNRLLARTLEQALAITAESAGRHGEKNTEVFPTELAILHFKRAQANANFGKPLDGAAARLRYPRLAKRLAKRGLAWPPWRLSSCR